MIYFHAVFAYKIRHGPNIISSNLYRYTIHIISSWEPIAVGVEIRDLHHVIRHHDDSADSPYTACAAFVRDLIYFKHL